MLLTGVDSHLAGVPNIPEMLPAEQKRHSHYQGTLGRNVVTVATLLQDIGYHTYIAGKWHLGMTPDRDLVTIWSQRCRKIPSDGACPPTRGTHCAVILRGADAGIETCIPPMKAQ